MGQREWLTNTGNGIQVTTILDCLSATLVKPIRESCGSVERAPNSAQETWPHQASHGKPHTTTRSLRACGSWGRGCSHEHRSLGQPRKGLHREGEKSDSGTLESGACGFESSSKFMVLSFCIYEMWKIRSSSPPMEHAPSVARGEAP